MYNDERSLVDHFVLSLQSFPPPWGNVQFATEFFYQRGRTDLVAVSQTGQVIAVEAKLKKWRIALQQAYRNRCFANLSYVLLPTDSAMLAYNHREEFDLRGVGICYLNEGELEVLHDATLAEPLQPWLRDQAMLHVSCDGVMK
jgi:hypothetical protein